MIGLLGHDCALMKEKWYGAIWVNENEWERTKFNMDHRTKHVERTP